MPRNFPVPSFAGLTPCATPHRVVTCVLLIVVGLASIRVPHFSFMSKICNTSMGENVSALIPLVSSTGFPISGSHDIYLHIFLCCCHWHASFGHGEYFSILVSNAVSLTENSAIISFWVLMVLDLFQPKISPTLSFSGMHRKLFIYHSSLATGPRIFSNLNYHARLGPL